LRVLIVDDSRAIRTYIRGVLLGEYDCEIEEVASGFEALRLLPRQNYDLVVTDINMPDINGLELIRFMRNSERHKTIPILIVSTQTSEQNRNRVFELGANDFVAKPFTPETFIQAVKTLVLQGNLADGNKNHE
jgi:two-component system, chemotaxis family, chemotaxis protein CheY